MIWLGEKRGQLSDWVTQQWVRATGCHISLSDHPWLQGPVGDTRSIGADFFTRYAGRNGYELIESGSRGLIPSFQALEQNSGLASVAQPVKDFYEETSEFEFDVWSEWSGIFKPFGRALGLIFGRRLQQLNLPISSMDTSRGMTSKVVPLRNPATSQIVHTAWIRELHATGNVLYAGAYSVCCLPGHASPCVRVIFPLPNGSAIVILRTEAHPDGSLSLWSSGRSFGDPGFYFVVHQENGVVFARYLKALTERIHVYPDKPGTVRTDHRLWFFGAEFLKLHYRMRRKG